MSAKSNKRSTVDYDTKILEVRNLKKHFTVGTGKNKLVVPAVDDVSFDIYKREIFGLVGESGSGKTTTGRTIIKLYNPTEGYAKLNDLQVSSGYMEYVRNIKNIKEKLRLDLIALEPKKAEIEKLTETQNLEEKKVKFKLEENDRNYELAKAELEADITEFKTKKYNLNEQYNLDLNAIKYDAQQEIARISETAINSALKEYKEEVNIQKNKFHNKHEGLKESAALSKEERSKRIELLKIENEEEMIALEERYKPLIAKAEKTMVAKEVAKEQISQVREKAKKAREALKAEFELANQNLPTPDYELFKREEKTLREKHDSLEADIKAELKAKRAETKLKIAAVKADAKKEVLSKEEKQDLVNKKKELRKAAKADILVEKQNIASAKQINNSKEALKASRNMQMIFQDPISSLNPRMTVREIVGEGLIIEGNYTKEEINEKVEETLELVGLAPEYAMRYPHEFSGGQRQRIGIARALIMNPNFIIADEPISALDVSIQAQVINLISDLKDELDLTVLFIAHDLSVVRFFCDRVAVMHNGKIVEMAETEELFKNPTHPYTISLLSAIPQPDPDYEKGRKRTHYDPMMHDYRFDKPELKELGNGHMIYVNDAEFKVMKKEYDANNKDVK